MSGFLDFTVAPNVLAKARAIGMYGNVENRLIRMAKASVPFHHPTANRRFEGFLLYVENGVIRDIMKFDPSKPTLRHKS